MTELLKKKLCELLELLKERNADGKLTEACTKLHGIIHEDDGVPA